MAEFNKGSNKLLLTGMAGAGKSTVGQILADRGYNTVNLDPYQLNHWSPKLCYWGTDSGIATAQRRWDDAEWLQEHYWRWRPEVMRKVILGHDSEEPLILVGRARNETDFYGYFNKVILLGITREVMDKRLDNREGDTSHTFGQHPVTREFLAASLSSFETRAIAAGAVLLDTTTQAPTQVADRVEQLCLGS